eukprot:11430-Heterococcus_DN1.PRE.1
MQKRQELRVHEVSEDPDCTYGKLFKPPPLGQRLIGSITVDERISVLAHWKCSRSPSASATNSPSSSASHQDPTFPSPLIDTMSDASSTTLHGVRGTATVVAPATGSMTDSSVNTPAIVVIPQQLFSLLVDQKSLDVVVDTAAVDEVVVTSTDDTAAGLAACIRVDTLATMLGVEPTEIPDCFFQTVWAAEK